jgi:adenosylmethionine-8-amino-7-oxononanoate aminotransferase
MAASYETLAHWDQAHVVHPWSFEGPTCMIVKGERSSYWDAFGREYLDALGGIQLCEVGHGRTELAEIAARQMAKLEYAPMFWNFGNEVAATLARRLAELAPDGIDQVYFTNGGSESCESAIKMARQYHHVKGDTSRTVILSLRHGYHGLTYGAMAATGLPGLQAGFGDPPPGFVHLSTPYPYRAEFLDGAAPVDYCVREVEETIDRLGADTIAAMIAEPVLTVGGAIVPPDGYWEAMTQICQRHGILMIADEVVTAFGRLGHWFASEPRGQKPDLIATAKGMTSGYIPLGGVLVSNEVASTLRAAETGFMHGFTYCGHPVACAVGLANLDIIEREGLRENALEVGAYLQEGLKTLLDIPVVGDVRGAGLLAGVELVSDKETRAPLSVRRQEIADRIRDEQGVIVRSIYQNIIIAPCLVLTRSEADRIVDALRGVLEATGLDGRPLARASAGAG